METSSVPASPRITSRALVFDETLVFKPLIQIVAGLMLPIACTLVMTILSPPGVPVTCSVIVAPLDVFTKQTPSLAHFLGSVGGTVGSGGGAAPAAAAPSAHVVI